MKKELYELLGTEAKIKKLNTEFSLPLFMTCRSIEAVSIEGCTFALVDITEEKEWTVNALKKQKAQYEEALQMPVAYRMELKGTAMRNALVKERVPFISLPGNIYLPFLGVILQDIYKTENVKCDKMMPATQMVFLELLYQESTQGFLKGEVAERLNLTKTSVTRATAQLEAMGLIHQRRSGVEVNIVRNYPPREYFERAKEHLINPVQKIIEVRAEKGGKELCYAGENALGNYSSLNVPRISEMAVFKGADIVDRFQPANIYIDAPEKCMRVQLWKYNPVFFAKEGYVDVVSLACSFTNEHDERIEMSIEEALERL